MEATVDDVITWVIQRSQETTAPAQVQFELQAIRNWRLHAGKPLGYIPFETTVTQGLLNFMNPSLSSIKDFEPHQLYVLQFWGVARFVEVQDMQIGHLVCRVTHFELIIFRSGGGTPKTREITHIYPTPARYAKAFCPVSILSTYCKA